ncbi:sensor domain-containing diguanylate cyclase [Colwellia sp. MSW7]|uniref:Sensor domain-containing diguanylate cyclase n=1 Tax=Colwellia maritima TaxID=2912588 RepID=A0ABS9X209_9GAMM|nr:sensor domain-containing diguanylate cyclase [Colwellia maritima]MCI2284254.1 sensor domain-containing diguanylate cyclase [Colwellia maritima]
MNTQDDFLELFIKLPIPLCLVSEDGIVLRINKKFTHIFGYDLDDMPTLQQWWLLAYPDSEYRDWVLSNWAEAVEVSAREGQDITPIEYTINCKDGTVREMEISGMTLANGFLATFIDVTERNIAQREIRDIAFLDLLTKVPNRRYFEHALQKSIAKIKRDNGRGALMVLDLDHFKDLNDTHGHFVGDLMLTEVAYRIRKVIRSSDTLARFGGDEFVVWIESVDTNQADFESTSLQVAEKIRAALEERYFLKVTSDNEENTIEHYCSTSIGVALVCAENADENVVFKQADNAMYAAKRAGKNRGHLFRA